MNSASSSWSRAGRMMRTVIALVLAVELAACGTVPALTLDDEIASDPVALANRPEALVALVTSNQLVFHLSNGRPEPVCLCGPKLARHEMSPFVRQAVIAIEDRRFYYHRGVDPVGILRGLSATVLSLGSNRQGGSTLTEQLIKNTVLTSRIDLGRRLGDAQLALVLEGVMSKDDILEAYLNHAVFGADRGRPLVGIEQGARYVFGRSARELNLLESAILAGMLRAPARLSPLIDHEAAMDRAAVVLAAMVDQGVITDKQRVKALKSERPRGKKRPIHVETRSFTRWVAKAVQGVLPGLAFDATTRIPLTLEFSSQFQAEVAMRRVMGKSQVAEANLGYVLMGLDGRVLVLIGQRDFGREQIDFVTQTNSQPASAFKPIVYAAALESRAIEPSKDLTAALARSDNDVARSVAKAAGPPTVISLARAMGITSTLRPDGSLALGGSEVDLLELTGAYLPFATGGLAAKPYGSLGVVQDGKILAWTVPTHRRVISREVAATMHRMLVVVVRRGTATAARLIPGAAGKTGTSDDHRDAWFIGMAEKHVSGIWMGRGDDAPVDGLTGSVAAGVWAQIELALP